MQEDSNARLHEEIRLLTLRATTLLTAGRKEAAEALWVHVLTLDPEHVESLAMLGLCAQQRGNHADALEHLRRASALAPNNIDLINALGISLKHLGRLQEALSVFEQALALRPEDAISAFNAGTVLLFSDRLEEAANRFEQAARAPELRLDALEALAQVQSTQSRFDDALATYETLAAEHPEHPTGHFGRCDTLLRMDRAEEALPHCRNSVALGPDNPAYLARLGDALHLLGSNAEAIARYEDALALDPTNLDVRNNLGATLKVLGQFRKAQEEFERCLEQNPDHLPALTNLAMALKEQGDAHLASRHLERAVRLAPDDLSLQLYLAMSRIPFAYATGEDIATCRAAYARDLTLLATAVASATPSTLAELARNIGRLQPYYLPYQGQNDCELMTLYGTIIHRTMNATWATLAQAAEHSFPAPPQAGERVRVGFVSGHFRDHSVWKLPTRGWCAGLDRERFMVTGYSVSSRTDPETAVARQIFDRFQEDLTTLPALAEAIRRDAPHILIYPELGMDPLCARAACLRLAPVQCVSWGHPQTSGLGTMDYFLSSDLMEPANSEEHYSEKLVRLPGLGVAYHPSSPAPSNERREDFGLREDDTVYLCLQTLYKYLPSQDATFATIAAKVPASRFVFLENSGAAHLNRLFRKRLEQAFTAAGLAPDRHLVFLPQLPGDRFQALASLGDIFLDSFGWSGCNSSLESMAHGAVPVTLPGALMRGRHTAAFLTVMDLPELIASSVEDYEQKASQLGLDPLFRRKMSDLVQKRVNRCHAGQQALHTLQDFLERTAQTY